MYEYGHGGNYAFEKGKEGFIDLSASINPLGMPEGVRDAIIREICNCGSYPDNSSAELRNKLSQFENVSADRVFCGGGASDIIFRLPGAIRAKKVMVAAPTFSDYERSALSFGSEVVRCALSPSDGFSAGESFVGEVRRTKPDLVFICNPNNPTGNLTGTGVIGELLDCCKGFGAYVAVDECFLDFAERAVDYTSKPFLEQYSNLVIIKAFTKMFALPGIRLGYAICGGEELPGKLSYNGADWPVSNLAQAAGMASLDGAGEFISKTVDYVSAERALMEQRLSGFGFEVYESAANFVFLRNPFPTDLNTMLGKKSIQVRSCRNFFGLDGDYYRIAVSTKENNAKLLAAVSEAMK